MAFATRDRMKDSTKPATAATIVPAAIVLLAALACAPADEPPSGDAPAAETPAAETPAAETPATAEGALEIRDPQAQIMPGGEMGVVYLTVVNPGTEADRLLAVESPAAGAAETHETVEEAGGVLRMVPRPEGFEIPAGGTLVLEPGGKHVMLMAPERPAEGTDELPLVLHFERAGAVEVTAPLRDLGGDGSGGSEHEMHDMDDHDMGDHDMGDHGMDDHDMGDHG